MNSFWSYYTQNQGNLFAPYIDCTILLFVINRARVIESWVSAWRAFLANAKESFIDIERGKKEKVLEKALYFYDKYTMQWERGELFERWREKIFFICLLCKFLTSQAGIFVYAKTCKLFPARCLAEGFAWILFILIYAISIMKLPKYPPGESELSLSNLIEAFIHFKHTATASYCCWGSEKNITKKFFFLSQAIQNNTGESWLWRFKI